MLLAEAGVFCRFLLLRLRRGPPALPESGLPLTMTGGGGGGDGGPGGQGGGGAALQTAPLTPGADNTGDTISDGHVEPDLGEPEVIVCSLRLDVYLDISVYCCIECRLFV